jgi:hypothetical protein
MLDSLVRVSRRAASDHYASILADAQTSIQTDRIVQEAITPPRGPRSPSLYPAVQIDAGLTTEECTGQKDRLSNRPQV